MHDPKAIRDVLALVDKLTAENAVLREIVECGCMNGQIQVGWYERRTCPDCGPLRADLRNQTP